VCIGQWQRQEQQPWRGAGTLLPAVLGAQITEHGSPMPWTAAGMGRGSRRDVCDCVSGNRLIQRALLLLAQVDLLIFALGPCRSDPHLSAHSLCLSVCSHCQRLASSSPVCTICRVCKAFPNSLCCVHLSSSAGLSSHVVDQVGQHCHVHR
jgi:hypothetical protein